MKNNMLIFKPELLLTKSNKPITINSEILSDFYFTYKDKNNKIAYERYTFNIAGLTEEEINKLK